MQGDLSPLEQAVIVLSQQDPLWSVRHKGGLAVWYLQATRAARAQPLANPELEALRRYAILRRICGGASPERERERKRLLNLGFSPGKIEEVDQLVARHSQPRQPAMRGARSYYRAPSSSPSSLGTVESAPPAFVESRRAGMFMPYQTRICASFIAIVTILPFALWSSTALAQSEPPMEAASEPPSDGPAGAPPGGPGGPGGGDRFAIGVGAAYMPAYHGSDEYRLQPLPAVDIKYGRFFVNFEDGIGANLIDNEIVTIGAGVVMADNYRAKDAPEGIGKLPFGVGARGFLKLRQFGFEAALGGTQIFAGSTKGFVADASLSYPIMLSQKFMLNPSIGTTWGNKKHLNRYFGVSAQQASASGLPQFQVGSGFLDAKAEVAALYRLTDRIGVGVIGGISSLMGDVKHSPIVEKKTRPYGIFFVSYEF